MTVSVIYVSYSETDSINVAVDEQVRRCAREHRRRDGTHDESDVSRAIDELKQKHEDGATSMAADLDDDGTVICFDNGGTDSRRKGLEYAKTNGDAQIIIDRLEVLGESTAAVGNWIDEHTSQNLRLITAHRGIEVPEQAESGHHDAVAPGAGTEHSGRPPVGYTVVQGRLQPADDFDDVAAALHAAADGDKSLSAAADQAGCSRRALRRILDDDERRSLYGL